jgi:glyoxylase-like metal-dependent hydrolase (beta-lactamase superfamily II)
VKNAAATNLGNLEEIDPASWQEAVAKVKAKFPGRTLTIPGHGKPDKDDLLARTHQLIREHLATNEGAARGAASRNKK